MFATILMINFLILLFLKRKPQISSISRLIISFTKLITWLSTKVQKKHDVNYQNLTNWLLSFINKYHVQAQENTAARFNIDADHSG